MATRHDRGRGGILPRRIMIDRHRLEAAGVDYDRMKIYHYIGTSKELKEAKMLLYQVGKKALLQAVPK